MIQILLDPNVSEKLRDLQEPAELVDSEGRVVARGIPRLDPSRYVGLECPLSPEELERRKAEKTGPTYTTAEVLKHLEGL